MCGYVFLIKSEFAFVSNRWSNRLPARSLRSTSDQPSSQNCCKSNTMSGLITSQEVILRGSGLDFTWTLKLLSGSFTSRFTVYKTLTGELIISSVMASGSGPKAAKQAQMMMLPPPCITIYLPAGRL